MSQSMTQTYKLCFIADDYGLCNGTVDDHGVCDGGGVGDAVDYGSPCVFASPPQGRGSHEGGPS